MQNQLVILQSLVRQALASNVG